MKPFTVLLVYVNSMLDNMIPINLSLLSACLKEKGFTVELFDTTCYRTSEKSADEQRVENLQVRPFDFSEYGVRLNDTDVFDEFYRIVSEHQPDLIGLSVFEPTFELAVEMLEKIKPLSVPSLVGGPLAILDPKCVISSPMVDMVCTAEGEEVVVSVAESLRDGRDLDGIKGLWFKREGQLLCNDQPDHLVDLNTTPYLDFSIYDPERFYKPMAGKIYRMVPIEIARGCCYQCSYCGDHAFSELFKGIGRWWRQKSIDRIFDEIDFYIKEYGAQYLYIVSETFLAMSKADFHEFVERYRQIQLPFWFNTRPETITEEKVRMLEEVGCDRMSIGLEHGNEDFRRDVLHRNYSNEVLVKAIEIVKKSRIALSVNNIIGFPDETRELIFDTIALNRRLQLRKQDSVSCFLLSPFKGTRIRRICEEKGYIDNETNITDNNIDYILQNPLISYNELMGIMRTFTSYCRLPQEYFPLIRRAESMDHLGEEAFAEVRDIYSQLYFS